MGLWIQGAPLIPRPLVIACSRTHRPQHHLKRDYRPPTHWGSSCTSSNWLHHSNSMRFELISTNKLLTLLQFVSLLMLNKVYLFYQIYFLWLTETRPLTSEVCYDRCLLKHEHVCRGCTSTLGPLVVLTHLWTWSSFWSHTCDCIV